MLLARGFEDRDLETHLKATLVVSSTAESGAAAGRDRRDRPTSVPGGAVVVPADEMGPDYLSWFILATPPSRPLPTDAGAGAERGTARGGDTPDPTERTLVLVIGDEKKKVTAKSCRGIARDIIRGEGAVRAALGGPPEEGGSDDDDDDDDLADPRDIEPGRVLLVSRTAKESCYVPVDHDVRWHLQSICHRCLLFDILGHELVPPHTHMSRADLDAVAAALRCDGGADALVTRLPRIGADDPVACALGGVPGRSAAADDGAEPGLPTVFRIDRPNGAVAYRVVVGDHGR
jgi:DNA-directed RNA polymerase subunit H (RpoH/RPB5)